jgi:NhaP-type Na+/H+ or K+/H+ antiporter
VTIAAVALLGWWWAGLVPAAALLLGAALAPTDPVLASDVQVGEPTDEEDSEDEVRFALTSEAGLNDGLAFPFVNAAIAMALDAGGGWFGEWLARDVLYKCAAGILGGLLVGKMLGRLFFRAKRHSLRLSRHSEGFLALAATFLAYGLVELAGGYGFLACSWRPAPSAPRKARTNTTRCCTTSRSRPSGCSPYCCCCSSGVRCSAACWRR